MNIVEANDIESILTFFNGKNEASRIQISNSYNKDMKFEICDKTVDNNQEMKYNTRKTTLEFSAQGGRIFRKAELTWAILI